MNNSLGKEFHTHNEYIRGSGIPCLIPLVGDNKSFLPPLIKIEIEEEEI